MKKVPVIEIFKDERRLIDAFGRKLVISEFEHEGERWVMMYTDSEDDEVRGQLEEIDLAIEVPRQLLEIFFRHPQGQGLQRRDGQ